ncbi:MAG: glycosyltransferase family 4 protein [Candidatus Moranbacteria bacterium]|nr:glycosyltransferase family 4 protein [Candidatus Moranbacteria bacterium]
MNILFISRAFPPFTGGIENQNAALAEWLPKFAETKFIINRHGKIALPWFLPFALFKACVFMFRSDILVLGDGVLAIIGAIIKILFPRKKVVVVLHGLDITYPFPLYQRLWIRGFLRSLDGYFCVSTHTKTQAIGHGVNSHKCFVIPNGVETERFTSKRNRDRLETILCRSLEGKIVLLTLGRLAKRKGVAWFIHHVLPQLNGNILYVVAGSGPEELAIRAAIRETNLDTRVILLGRVSQDDVLTLLNSSDIFVQPNIHVSGDMEGFGIAVIEAGSAGLPVVASDLEGLRDAIQQGENGFLVKPERADGFIHTINELAENNTERRNFGDRAARFVENTFHWNTVTKEYIRTLTKIMKQ